MSNNALNVLAVAGSLHNVSVTRAAITHIADGLRQRGCLVDLLDLKAEPLPLYEPDSTQHRPEFKALQARVERADVLVLGTPDYHGSVSGTLKNFLDHFWREFAGKLIGTVVASHEKGLTATDQLRTIARQCYAWTLPYGVSLNESSDIEDGQLASSAVLERLEMMVRDLGVYGGSLARQRTADLAGSDSGFLARLRK